ncbi:hypothetical protein GIB67_003047 [Kingdonia uniflora]|uniref:Uncharacterized protein n=1 Tax=Kingdonia uniflora TaxID=39325 RepID=A0A7J7LUQ1_9MAGN|nr:hypothetical protein GIB67_031331 [Kingdonia uniflora]KAF6147716.1 hypothetical protein GIB67_003047 [Kingdonia uniflora]
MGHGNPLEVIETVMEVADVAWTAMELRHHHHHNHQNPNFDSNSPPNEELQQQIASLRSENLRLRNILEENLKLIEHVADHHHHPSLSDDCPPDLYKHLSAAVDSATFLTQLGSLQQASLGTPHNGFPFKQATGADLQSLETLVNVGTKEPSWWVWVTDENVPSSLEEWSGIDNDGYLIVSEEHVVDGVANFIASCILSNPKAKTLTPEELKKTVTQALGSMNKLGKMLKVWHAGQIFYILATWGLAFSGLYRHRAVVRLAAKGVGATGKIILKAL